MRRMNSYTEAAMERAMKAGLPLPHSLDGGG
jgi:hypothetical protein